MPQLASSHYFINHTADQTGQPVTMLYFCLRICALTLIFACDEMTASMLGFFECPPVQNFGYHTGMEVYPTWDTIRVWECFFYYDPMHKERY